MGLFGGGIEAGESPYECIVRELGEETSLDAETLAIDFIGCYGQPDSGRCSYVFRAVVESADFTVYEGKGAEVHTLEALRMRDDLTATLHLIVHTLDIAP